MHGGTALNEIKLLYGYCCGICVVYCWGTLAVESLDKSSKCVATSGSGYKLPQCHLQAVSCPCDQTGRNLKKRIRFMCIKPPRKRPEEM